MVKCNSLSIDVDGLWKAIWDQAKTLVYDIANGIIDEFGSYAWQDGAGKHEWRENAAKEFQIITNDVSDEMIKVVLGLNKGLVDGSPYAAQIMVALFGNHPPIFSQPGSEVWNGDMTGKRQSLAMHVYGIPQLGWEDPGASNWLENCFKDAKKNFEDGLKARLSTINFYDYVHVTAGG